jgi:ribonuclease HI
MKADVYTDGSCAVNPGPMGAAAVVLIRKDNGDIQYKQLMSKSYGDGTNNRAELHGVILGLSMIGKMRRPEYEVTVYCDSQWVIGALSGTFKKVTKNLDLLSLAAGLAIEYKSCRFVHVSGHAGHKWNELVDSYAVAARTSGVGVKLDNFYMPKEIPIPTTSFKEKL